MSRVPHDCVCHNNVICFVTNAKLLDALDDHDSSSGAVCPLLPSTNAMKDGPTQAEGMGRMKLARRRRRKEGGET